MPSFSDCYSHMLKGTFLKSKLHYQCAMSLQVPCILPLINIVFILGKRVVAFRAKCKMFSRHLQKPILKTEKGRFKGL